VAQSASKVVGVDIGTSGLRAVELHPRRKSGDFVIAKAASVELPIGVMRGGLVVDDRAVVSALRRLWRKGHFTTRRVAISIADSSVLTRQVDLPWMPPDDFRAALKYQVTEALPVDLSTVQLDYHLLGESSRLDEHGQAMDMNRVLVVAAPTDAVMAAVDAVKGARLEPITADSTAFALIRAACRGHLPADDETHAIADIGADQMTVVVHQSGQPRFVRTIVNVGGSRATAAVADRLDVDLVDAERIKRDTGLIGPAPIVAPIAESTVFGGFGPTGEPVMDPRSAATIEALNPWATALIGEIRNSLDYFQASDATAPIRTLTIVGRGGEMTGLIDRIATQIPLPVRRMDPFAGLATRRGVARAAALDTRLVLAIGLAMGE
jgi:type IV pilus assembly protein PilM